MWWHNPHHTCRCILHQGNWHTFHWGTNQTSEHRHPFQKDQSHWQLLYTVLHVAQFLSLGRAHSHSSPHPMLPQQPRHSSSRAGTAWTGSCYGSVGCLVPGMCSSVLENISDVIEFSDQLEQWFSTRVPGNPRVPWPPSRGSVRFFRNLYKI